ncbi:MAG: carbon starvation protein A [Candidatus Marinimicrobia bacterium]|nr:carbon starvation protein A [Candidatus Neomarinimicrobiota bacterium]MCF7850222.1 carbon starvation protein A [Candidatus Neomarinimicrobiota bacterium]MCF7903736.1 carbon starvation protein A [Candidatus Neomarinimicrobiota bacterium]
MEVIILMILTFVGYYVAYQTYGKYLSTKIFKLSAEHLVPSKAFEDGMDFIPTKKGIIFGHHYTSIAGTGPIVGPAIGIIWGWVPALLWVFLGSIFMGAVHDLGSLVLSLRNQGKSLSDYTAKYMNRRVRYIVFSVIYLELLIIIAIFGLVIAVIFDMFPQAVFPVWFEIPIAAVLGWLIYTKSKNVVLSTIVAVTLMYTTVVLGHFIPIHLPPIAGIPPTGIWTIILLIYVFFASTIPVNRLLQPRDFINAWQLFIAAGLLVLGVLFSGIAGDLTLVAPAYNPHAVGAPPLLPFLFITIACGAISGFHSVVSSGTTSKQVSSEPDALFIGYGSMLMEAVLATLVIIAVAAGIGIAYETGDGSLLTGPAAWQEHYQSWSASQGLGSKVSAVVIGSANMMESLHIPKALGIIIMGVFIASFAGTTMDSATRIQRYVISELFSDLKQKNWGANRFMTTAVAVVTAAILAFSTGANGKGALTLWPLFGAVNQLLAGLALLVLTVWLRKKRPGLSYLLAGIPAGIILVMTIWAIILSEGTYLNDGHILLAIINFLVLLLAVWMLIESWISIRRPVRSDSPE